MSPALQALLFYKQFILYKLVPSKTTPGKTDKLPVNPLTMGVEDAHNPSIWCNYEDVKAMLPLLGKQYGVGFVFTEADPFFFIDIDDCLVNGEWSEVAKNLMACLPGAAVEVSQSGKGLHIFGTTGPIDHGCKNKALGLEMYTSGRFAALTDSQTSGNAATDCTQLIPQIVNYYFPPLLNAGPGEDWRDTPVDEWNGIESDDDLIEKMLKSSSAKSTFGHGASFKDLWTNNELVLSSAYPTLNEVDPYDRSSADMALAHHLAFWTGKNHARIERLMQMSGLVRDKWRLHVKYLKEMTITHAVNNQTQVYGHGQTPITPQVQTPITPEGTDTTGMTTGVQFLTPSAQEEHFKGCVYVRDLHKVFVPDGGMLKPDQFKATYGGYTFSMDMSNEKTTRNAWECFRESQAIRFPMVHQPCFRPELPAGKIIEEESYKLVNTYIPIKTKRKKGDVSRFLELMKKILPLDRDRAIMLAYMSACVQYPGVKFQWCPLIQGTEGNGKTLLGTLVAHSVGHRYTHLPNASELAKSGAKFNAWISNKLLIIIEEIYTTDKRELTEPLKVLITNSRLEIQGKGDNQITGDNRANFIMFSNHKDAISVTIDTRRYCIMYSAQQSNADINRDGMGGRYFYNLYKWLREDGGYAFINDYLHTYAIPDELNPATLCQRAPATQHLEEAIELSIGGVEAEIMDAIEQGIPGFCFPWVSSMALDKLLKDIQANRRIPKNKRKDMLSGLGYVLHPALNQGRLNQDIAYEGGKPSLYIKRDHMLGVQGISGFDVYTHYMKAQGYATTITMPVAQNGASPTIK